MRTPTAGMVGTTTLLDSNVTSTAFLDPTADLVSGQEYYYKVSAVSGATQSAPSNGAHAFANGPLIYHTVDFSNGFPASSASQFTSTGSVFNANSTISVGGTLAYNEPVNAKQFNVQFEFTQPNAGTVLDLSLVLKGSGGTSYRFSMASAPGKARHPTLVSSPAISISSSTPTLRTYPTRSAIRSTVMPMT